jgi:hypothetical protein
MSSTNGRLVARALAGLCTVAAGALLVGCGLVGQPARALPRDSGTPTFLVEASDARGTLLLGTPQGLFRSSDEGVTWHTTYPPIYRAQSAAFTSGSTIVSRGRLLHRGNLTFDRIEPARRAPFRGGFVRALTWLPGGKLYAFVLNAQASIYVTLDSARTWYARPAVGLPRTTRSIAAMAVPGRSDMLLAAAGEKGLWRSLDGGLTWEPVPAAGKPVWSVTASPGAQGRVLVAGPQLQWSVDYGVVWHKAGWPEARLVASDPRNPKIFLAVMADGTIRASTDAGHSF